MRFSYTSKHGIHLTYDNDNLLNFLKLGHYKCCKLAIENEENPRTLEISSLFEDGDRSMNRLQAVRLLKEFNFPINEEKLEALHLQSPFCQEMIEALSLLEIEVVQRRFMATKSAAK